MQVSTKLGLIGDVHCEHESLALAITTLRAENVETIICTGDLPTGPGNINVCCDLLRKNKIPTIRGNHDRWLLDLELFSSPMATLPSTVTKSSWRFLESLPVTIDLPTPKGLALICHGLGGFDMLSIVPGQTDQDVMDHSVLSDIAASNRYRWIINGHSHHRMVRNAGPLTIINAGTLRRDHNPCFAVIDFERSQVRFWNIVNQQIAVPGEVEAM